ncbi:hypothetical protein J6O86_05525 [bacterium]|nr:hypothetical protein [bacterium]
MDKKKLVLFITIGILFIFLFIIGFLVYSHQTVKPGVKNLAKEKIGVIYCSYNNDGVKDIVDIISKKIKSEVIELKPAVAYPTNKEEFVKRVDTENADISKVVLDNKIIDLRKYKLVIFATPVLRNKTCPVLQKFIDDNAPRIVNKPVASVVRYEQTDKDIRETLDYLYYRLHDGKQKPNFVTYARDKKQLEYEIGLWFDEMEFERGDLR